MSHRFCSRFMLAFAALCSLTAWGFDSNLPQYRLEPGQELRFEGMNLLRYEGGRIGTKENWTVWVVNRQEDGTCRLVVRLSRESTFGISYRDPTAGPDAPLVEPDLEFNGNEFSMIGWCHLSPDGRITPNKTIGVMLTPAAILAPLPQSQADLESGWTLVDDWMDETLTCSRVESDEQGIFKFQVHLESEMDHAYGSQRTNLVSFDIQRGVPVSIVDHMQQTSGTKSERSGTLDLADVQLHSADWLKEFIKETDQYFRMSESLEDTLDDHSIPPEEFTAVAKSAIEEFSSLADSVRSEQLKTTILHQARNEQQKVSHRVERLKYHQSVVGSKPEAWSTTDFRDQPISISDLEGKVVIMDFWYRNCGWCVRAMPQVKEIAEHFQEAPVVVLGMNTDENADDALEIINDMQLNYNNLRASGIPEKYNIQGFPTLIILDREGVVHDVHVGYSHTLRDDVIATVEKLLETTE